MGLLDRIKQLREANRKKEQNRKTKVEAKKVEVQPTPIVQLKPKVYGNRGRLEIPSLNISVPLYDTSVGSAQRIVDNQDSAVILRWVSQYAIADHSSQSNFQNLNYAKPGITTMSIETKTAKDEYKCVKTQVGHIKIGSVGGNTIYDENWQPPNNQNQGGICIYTCIHKSAPDVMDIRMTYWQPVNS